MGIAAAFDAADRPNKFLLLDDEGTLLHGPAPNPDGAPNAADKRCGIRTAPLCATKKLCKTLKWNPIETVPPRAATSEAECGQRVRHWDCTRLQSYDIPGQASCRFWNFNPQ
jgi:hypothetical protein